MKTWLTALILPLLSWLASPVDRPLKVSFKNLDTDKRIEVFIGGKLFTAFIYPDDLEKPVLYPVISASGKYIARGYPLAPRPFERTDHPHQIGLWLNFGNVNGLDFWNNSFAVAPADKPKYGSIRFRKVLSEDPAKGKLVTASDWVDFNGRVLLTEKTTFVFAGTGSLRTIDRTSDLTAVEEVTFSENKEGLLGMRLDRAFEEPATQPEKFLDSSGKVTEVPAMNNEGVNGVYRNARGDSGSAVWSVRCPWVADRAVKEGETITIVEIDHPRNPNYPAWSHARGYGLFATNNLGGRALVKDAKEVKVTVKPGEHIIFRHMVVIGGDLTDAEINRMAQDFGK